MPAVSGYARPTGLLNPNWSNWTNPGAPMGLKGVLGKYFDPREMRYRAGSEALLQAGLGILNPDPHAPPSGIAGLLGRGISGAAQGARQGKEDFYNEGMQNYQLSEMQRGEDERTAEAEEIKKILPSLPPEIQGFARVHPGAFMAAYTDAKLKSQFSGSNWKEVILDDGVYAVNESNPKQKMRIGDRANRNEGEGRGFLQADKLRDDYTKQADPFSKRRESYQGILAAYQGAQTNPDNPGPADISMIYQFMKMLDPGSTVMQGEYANAQNAGGIPQSVITTYNNLLKGDKLSPALRDAFVDQATAQYESALNSYGGIRKTFVDLATSNQLDPNLVAPDYTYGVVPYKRKSGLDPDALRKKYNLRPTR